MSQPLLIETDTYVFWSHGERGGWMHLLPKRGGLRLLCVDPRGAVAWALARDGDAVTLVESEPAWPAADSPILSTVANVHRVQLDALIEQSRAGDFKPFDGLVIQDLSGRCIGTAGLPELERLLAHAAALLSPAGWIYLGAANRHSLLRWRHRLRPGQTSDHPVPSRARLTRLLKQAGMSEVRQHPYLLEQEQVVEVLGPHGYRATKNVERLVERVKQRLFGRWGAPRLSPAFGLLGRRAASPVSAMDELVQRLGLLRAPAGAVVTPPVLKHYLVFAGHKVIATIGPGNRNDYDVVAVLTGDAVSTRGRTLEAPHLKTLAALPQVAARVPRPLDRFEFNGCQCFVLDHIPGVTLDRVVPLLSTVTWRAMTFLIDLHLETARPMEMAHAGRAALIEPLLDAASKRNPQWADAFGQWLAPLSAAVASHTLPAVFQHGDFKIENVIYTPGSGALRGVIDWEHARNPGVPVLDLMYLLVYNRIIRGSHWTTAINSSIALGQWTPEEQECLRHYMSALGIPESLMLPLRALFLAHHVGCRIHLSPNSPWDAPLAAMIEQLSTQLRGQEPDPA